MNNRLRKCRGINSITNVKTEGDAAGAAGPKGVLHLLVPYLERGRFLYGSFADELWYRLRKDGALPFDVESLNTTGIKHLKFHHHKVGLMHTCLAVFTYPTIINCSYQLVVIITITGKHHIESWGSFARDAAFLLKRCARQHLRARALS